MAQMLGMITGVEFVVLAGASAVLGTILGRRSKNRRYRNVPEKRIEITVQRMDRPYRKRPFER